MSLDIIVVREPWDDVIGAKTRFESIGYLFSHVVTVAMNNEANTRSFVS